MQWGPVTANNQGNTLGTVDDPPCAGWGASLCSCELWNLCTRIQADRILSYLPSQFPGAIEHGLAAQGCYREFGASIGWEL